MKSKDLVRRILTIMTAAIMAMTSLGFVSDFGTKAFAEPSSGKMIAGAEALKEGVNTENARLVHYGDRYWYVIGYDREGVAAGSGEITLLSKDSIKSTAFDKNYSAVYSSSNLKKEIEEYTNDKLSAGEKSVIVSRDLSAINARAKGDLKWWFNNFRTVDEVLDNRVEGAMLWPLSAKEATEVNENIRKTGTGYWLRSLGVPEYEERYWYGLEEFDVYVVPAAMATVWDDGSVDIQAEKENTTYWHGMRPAFKLNKNNIVMVSAATGGKESEEDGTLTEAGAVTEKNLKLTLKDDAHKDFYVNPCDVESGEGGSLTVKYSSASTGENEYISAVIKGADGNIKQYGRLAKATEASGTATIKGLPTDGSGKVSLPEGDRIYVFNEQYNGDEKTDYVSNLREISLTGHNWVFDDLKWDSLTGEVEASYHCSIDGNHTTTANGEYTLKDIPPTCEEKGKLMQVLSISAEKSPDGKAHSKSIKKSDQDEPLGHVYNHFFGFRWTGDATSGYKKAEAIFACDHDYSHKTYVEANVTSKVQEPTCEGIGRTLYQATLSADKSPDGRNHGEAKYAKATKKLGHDWGEPTYEWASDNSSVTATRVCKRDSSHVETETVATEATNITKEPTCKAEGKGDVKTKPFTNEAFSEQTKENATIPVDPNAHAWDDGEQQGDPNTCGGYTIIYRCTLCESGQKEEITGGSNHTYSPDWTYFPKPTCTESGQRFHECTKCGAFDFGDFEVLDPTGHAWKFVDFTWTGNENDGYTKAVANYVCKNDEDHKMTAPAEITDEVIDPTCTEGGKTVYTASISAADSPDESEHSESKDANITEKVPHEWEYSGMEWTGNETDGYTKAAAKYSCKFGCGETQEVEATLTEKETEADCENDGKITYTATEKAEDSLIGEEHTDSKDVKTADALGHDWHLSDMIWTGDEESGFTKAEAKFVCNNDESHEGLVEAKLTESVTEPTCAEEGYTMYQAKVDAADSLNGAECTDVNFAKIKEPTGHAWELKSFTWTEDDKYGYRAMANYVCKHDESHAESVGADMRKTEKTATCEEPGGTLYTAIVDKDKSLTDAEVTEDKLVKTSDPTGHKWGAPKYTWSKDNKSVTAQAVCEHDSKHIKKETVKTTSKVTKKATCRAAGSMTYTATFKDALFKTQTKNATIARTKHTWGAWKVTKKATVNTRGTKTRTCSVCGKKETKSIPKLKVSGTLMMNAVSSGSKALKLSWTKVNNAAGYDIYMARCNYKGRSYTFKKVRTISGNKTFTWTNSKLSTHTAYKGFVRAYTIRNGKKVYVRKSPLVHAFTGNYRNSLTNPKSIKVNKTSVSIAKGKTATIKATVKKARSGLGFPDNHEARVRYLTTNKKIAKVNSAGRITAKSKGTCYVYAYAQNGLWKTVKVTVK